MSTENDTNTDLAAHIIVVGAGAMGCYFGGTLIQAGHKVTFIDVNPDAIESINKQGIILETDNGSQQLPAVASTAQDATRPASLVVLFTKTLHTEAAMRSINHLLTPNSIILSLQNGLGNADKIAKFHDPARIAVGTTLVPADLKGPRHVASHGPSSSRLMDAATQNPPWVTQLGELFNNAGLSTTLDPNIHSVIWSKVAFNAALNAICAVTGATPGSIGDVEASVKLANSVVTETVNIAMAKGISVEHEHIWENVTMAMREHRYHKPSMLQDIEQGRATEIDAINGAIVAAGEALNIDAPANKILYQLVKLKEYLSK